MRTILLLAGAMALIVLVRPHDPGTAAKATGSAAATIDSKGAQATISMKATLSWRA